MTKRQNGPDTEARIVHDLGRHRDVLVGLDADDPTPEAVAWGAHEAELRDAPLHIVTCYDPAEEIGLEPDSGLAQYLRDRAAKILDRAVEEVREQHPGVKVDGEVLVGDAAQELARCSGEAGLVITGSRPMGALKSWFLGSVSSALARTAQCPLVAVRPTEDAELPRDLMVVGIDLTEAAQDVLHFAFAEADRHHWRMRIVMCARPDLLTTPHGSYAQLIAHDIAPELAEVLAGWRGDYPDVDVSTAVVVQATVPALVEAAADAALLVVGSRRREHHLRLGFGSVAQGALHHAVCPVAVVPTR